ncbi:sensory box/GGDEF family protein [Vibrio metschnikovii]|nr:diguanylate cyclase/phosphodiesterase with PAS/PAC and GAF sensor(s) [Vibrio metschnikovii CIP 69.14]SUP49525.1 sensory box/GGDEF family protein [Vibrio metschnikovii]SUQ10077.1 sensory box/GGDEF family protein [Vibrio metschnikovii]
MPSSSEIGKKSKKNRWELKFTTRITLLFGFLSLFTLLISMFYSIRTAEISLHSEIENSLAQRQRTVQSLIENRLDLLEVYLHTTASNQVFTSLTGENFEFNNIAEDMIYMFQDSALGANLDIFFLTDSSGKVLMDAGLPLYNIEPMLNSLRSPLHYTSEWALVHSPNLTALLKATPIFDPASIQLRGYMFIGLAIGQNRSFIQTLAERADLDALSIHYQQARLIQYSPSIALPAHSSEETTSSQMRAYENLYLLNATLNINNKAYPLNLKMGIDKQRFTSVSEHYWQTFFLLSGVFLLLLILAAWLLHLSHSRAISQLTDYIQGIQKGLRVSFSPTGIYEYNQVGDAMQHMVENLKIAATVFESAEGMVVTDEKKHILRVNQAFTDITGYQPKDVLGHHIKVIRSGRHNQSFYDELELQLKTQGSWQGEIFNKRKNGEEYLQWTMITAVISDHEDEIINYVITLIDITQRKAAESKIKQLAFYDQLTGLPNRQLLMERLESARLNSQRNGQYGAILYLDLDDFKTLNDTRGHDTGDKFLTLVSQRLLDCVRRTDTVARIGGDEFVIILEQLDSDLDIASKRADLLCRKILDTLSKPYYIDNIEHFSTLSIGVTLFLGETKGIDELLKHADLAMYQAKGAGRNTHRFFNPEMQAKVLEHAAMANDIRHALTRNEFTLYYQPQVTHDGQLTGAEALIRWQHPKQGTISPIEFIPIAEETGLILPLGEWVLDQACQVLAVWQNSPLTDSLVLAINISAKQFHQTGFVQQVLEALQRYRANPDRLKLELTESMLHEDLEDTITKMSQLKKYGVSFSLDDFGTGYSSLNYLKRLPLDQLKIDKSFVRDLLTNSHDADIARTIVSLAKSMNLAVIAEGVETQEQRLALASYGCLDFQGYLFSRPVPLEAFPFNYPDGIPTTAKTN